MSLVNSFSSSNNIHYPSESIDLSINQYRHFKAIAAVQISISMIYCLIRCIIYHPENSRIQALYDKANLVVYGIVGMASGIVGIIGVDLNLLSCFQTFAVLSLGISVYLSTHIFSLWLLSYAYCVFNKEAFCQGAHIAGLSIYSIMIWARQPV
ncbi:Oidioi.mRNA.OKI2018_I69.PAR.g13189.t1.cds [Oikopleura dioica]|uniref:Oidioi.mRNA.OKI2018_I69.PAR.g13189.t1.cds n=1 Tax=Oikopleura dioica TaxID=34765 RepID=A0ABN7S6R9_OIKDI|nr:Oidioi.mRNA.OKI2018_I69.PAR.g13189.t1.cds [Oikopleura dioica]